MKHQLQVVWDHVKGFFINRIHFLELHYFYIFVLIMVSSGLYYCQPGTNWNYVDALFTATTGVTNTGLNTIDMSSLSVYQVILMMFGSFFGSHVMVSFIVVLIRKHYFSKRFEDYLLFNKVRRLREEHQRHMNRRIHEMERENSREDIGNDGSSIQRVRSLSSVFTVPAPLHEGIRNRIKRHRRMSLDQQSLDHQQEMMDLLNRIRKRSEERHHDPVCYFDPNRGAPIESGGEYPNRRRSTIDAPEPEVLMHPTTTASLDRVQSNPPLTDSPDELPKTLSKPPTQNSQLLVHPTDIVDERNLLQSSDDINNNDNTGSGTHAIVFADDIEQQRELARQRLEQDRQYQDMLHSIAGQEHGQLDVANDQPSEINDILREPCPTWLTREQRYYLGGVEYRALDMLARLVPLYYVGLVVVFGFLFRIYVAASSFAQNVLETSNTNGPVNPWLFCFFQSLSAFNNLGLMLIDASMIPFQNSPCPLIFSMFLILAGNTAYAIFLRFIVWIAYKLTPKTYAIRRETFRYLLDHPRRCYTNLFPSTQTWWLLAVLICITLIEFTSFVALNYWLPVLGGIPWGSRIIDGLFQSVATRNAGFSVVNLMDLNPGTQIVFIIAMYISVYPVAISMRNSNVYQERALGIYKTGDDNEGGGYETDSMSIDPSSSAPILKLKRHSTLNSVMSTSKRVFFRKPDFFVMTQIQRQLTSEISWVIICIFAVCVIEAKEIMAPSPITIATVIYECVSAFGNVGASTGYPETSTSQAGSYRTLSKLVLILLMYRGRHRGLPVAIDHAVLLPSEQLEQEHMQDVDERRRNTISSQGPSSGAGRYYFHHDQPSTSSIF